MAATTEKAQQAQAQAQLARLCDAVTAIAAQQGEQREVQQNMLAVLHALLETNQAQSEMLADILGAATLEAGPSPVAEALETLAAQVRHLDETQTGVIAQLVELPEAIGRQFEASLRDWPTTAAPH